MPTSERIAVAMSGGLDSSMAALLLREQGYDVVGLSMQLWDHAELVSAGFSRCCSPGDLADARRVAEEIGIPHYVLDGEEPFRDNVLEYFFDEYRRGRTPVPCVPCNAELKFGLLVDKARQLGAERVATGHYVRTRRDPDGRWLLERGRDRSKDQSYYLFDLTQEQLARARFPLGELTKEEVRRMAAERGLSVADKPESQDLCFTSGASCGEFLERNLADRPPAGDIVDEQGRRLGGHDGIHRFTVGQRRGLGVAASQPLYVLRLDPSEDQVVVGPASRRGAGGLVAEAFNWISGRAPRQRLTARVRIRAGHAGVDAEVDPRPDGRVRVRFASPQESVAPGQAAVLYDDDVLLGGGFIAEVLS